MTIRKVIMNIPDDMVICFVFAICLYCLMRVIL